MDNKTKIYVGIGAVAIISFMVYNHIKNKYQPTNINTKKDTTKNTKDSVSCSLRKLLGLKCDQNIIMT